MLACFTCLLYTLFSLVENIVYDVFEEIQIYIFFILVIHQQPRLYDIDAILSNEINLERLLENCRLQGN